MKTIIAGGRNYYFTEADIAWLNTIDGITEVVSGMASGADTCGEDWAISKGIPVKRSPAQWHLYGKRAGSIRNQEMADYADALVVFPGGTGTTDMVKRATAKKMKIFRISDNQNNPLSGLIST